MSEDKDYLDNLRHSCAHLLAAAVMELWPDAKRTIGPPIEDGFYYDFDFGDVVVSEKDLPKIEKRMKKILNSWKGFERSEVSVAQAKEFYADNVYKIELIDEFSGEGQQLTMYKSGEYSDLCRGGHCDDPKSELKHFKLLSVAGAYWRGDERNKMLTRIYGTCFPSPEELQAYLDRREEAKKRDHRKIGRDQELFFIDEMVGKGLAMWLPNGTIIREEIEKLAKEKESAQGYKRVVTPHLAKQDLFLTSGHLPYYKDGMYPAMHMDDGVYYIKAMNCPHHHRMYLHKPHSYRELPVRLAEYGMVYRNELSGTLAGLLRVRGLAMNDAHIYCNKDQIKDEFKKIMDLTLEYFKIFGLNEYYFRLSKWSPEHTDKYADQPENWELTQDILRSALEEMKVDFVEADDEAAFYGPKVDVQFKSVIGREETMSTIQLDFLAKDRFGLSYTDKDGKENNDVFVIHRAPLSVHERFMAFLIEHYAGVWPLWLAPKQIVLAPVGEAHADYAHQQARALRASGLRVYVDDSDETIGKKIRKTQQEKVPYVVVLGDKEVGGNVWQIRVRGQEDQPQIDRDEFVKNCLSLIDSRSEKL